MLEHLVQLVEDLLPILLFVLVPTAYWRGPCGYPDDIVR